MSLGKNSLNECVMPAMVDSWNELKNNFFPNGVDTDKRTPGLFKDEYTGTKFLYCLSCKNYIVHNDELLVGSKEFKKVSSKSINDKNLLSFDDFKKELDYYNER